MANRTETIQRLRTEIHALERQLGAGNRLIDLLRHQLSEHESCTADERREHIFRRAAWDLVGRRAVDATSLTPMTKDDISKSIVALGAHLDQKYAEIRAMREVTEYMNGGHLLNEVMDNIFPILEKVVPYDRIGVSMIDTDQYGYKWVRLEWVRAKYKKLFLKPGYASQLDRSHLPDNFFQHDPQIINDMEGHADEHPNSVTAALLLKEGVRSNLTYPINGRKGVIGYIFFSSHERDTYVDPHIDIFAQIATELGLVIEKGRIYEQLCQRNEMLKDMFGRYVTEEIADMVLSGNTAEPLKGQRCKVTILFADLRNFTSMSESLAPEKVVEALNIYLRAMTQLVMRYEGRIDNFIGDGILAVFGAPRSTPTDAARAVACAIAMENEMATINEDLVKRGLPALAMGIGLNTGDVVAGNIGSELRMTYSVIGNPVNVASRLSSLAAGGQLLATESTFREVKGLVEAAGSLRVSIKGIQNPVQVIELTAITGDYGVRKNAPADPLLIADL